MADYVVSTWEDFLQYNTSDNNIKFANPHEVNGEIVLEGDGTQNNPYIVSTYEEMLSATGATYIWEVKLINREQKIYRHDDIYCRYDDSLSIIDFNQIQPEGYNENLVISAAVDGNGWTWRNMKFDSGAQLQYANTTAPLKNIRITNFYAIISGTDGIIKLTSTGIRDSILDIYADSTGSNKLAVFRGGSSNTEGRNVSMALTLRGGGFSLSGTQTSGYVNFVDSVIVLDVDSTDFYIGNLSSSYSYGGSLKNVAVKGEIKTSSTGDVSLGKSITSCIFDVSYSGNGKLAISSNSTVKTASFYNSDKVEDETGLEVTNMIGSTTNDLKSAQYLYDHGLPIGVDDE